MFSLNQATSFLVNSQPTTCHLTRSTAYVLEFEEGSLRVIPVMDSWLGESLLLA